MFQKFDENTKKVIKNAKIEMQNLKHSFVGSEHLILSILSNSKLSINSLLKEYNLTYNNFKYQLLKLIGEGNSLNSYFIYTPLLKRIIESAILDAKENNISEVNVEILFLAILSEGEGIGIRVLKNLNINVDELYLDLKNREKISKQFKNKKNLLVNEYAINLNEKAKNGQIESIFGREKEINRLIEILLRKNKNNPLLIGEAGVGKTAIIENLALKIYKKKVPTVLLDKIIYSISMSNLVAGTKYRGEFEEKVEKLVNELEQNPNIILFIDEIHSLVGAGGAEGAIDASNILKPSLARGKLKIIGATTLKEYKNSIEKDKALNRRFQTILINESSIEETKDILKYIKKSYEIYHGVVIKDDIINNIVNLSNKYIFNRKNPDKSIDILDEVCVKKSLIKDKKEIKLDNLNRELEQVKMKKNDYIIKHNFEKATILKEQEMKLENQINNIINKMSIRKEITMQDVYNLIETKTNIPIYKINHNSLKKINELNNKLKKVVIGQDEAIDKLFFEFRKKNLGLNNSNKPISFLFTGKTGVGKTKLVKEFANLLNINLIRIDASEYKEEHSISKIIGSPPGYVGYSDYSVLDEVKNNPYSIILIDEVEKSCSNFLNLFLQILDEGFITNSLQEKIYFNHIIIIMTSNISEEINKIGFNNNVSIKNNLNDYFSIELLNRINNIIRFNELKEDDIKLIVNKELKYVKNKFKIQGIDLIIQKNIVKEIINMSNYQEYGARKIVNIIEEKINNIVINNLLDKNKKIIIKE